MRLTGIPGQEARLRHRPISLAPAIRLRETPTNQRASSSNEYGVYICKRRTAKLLNLHTFTSANAGFLRSSYSGVMCHPYIRCEAPLVSVPSGAEAGPPQISPKWEMRTFRVQWRIGVQAIRLEPEVY